MARPRLPFVALLALAVLGLASIGCSRSIAKPGGWSSPTLANGVILVAHSDKLYALDPTTLEARWRFPPSGGKNNPSPVALYGSLAASQSTVFVPGYDGKLYAVSTTDGSSSTTPFVTDGPLVGGVALSGTTVYFGSSDGNVYAVSTASGKELWRFTANKEIWSTPLLDGDALYVTSLDDKLYVLDATSGALRWSFATDAGIASPAVLDKTNGVIYLAGLDSQLRAIDLQTHRQRWAFKADNWFWTIPLVISGTVYAGSLDQKIYAIDIATGKPHWARPFSTTGQVRAAPVMAGGKLIIVDRGGHVFALSPQDGTMAPGVALALGADVLADPLVLADGKVLFVTTAGEAIRVDPTTLTITDRKKVA